MQRRKYCEAFKLNAITHYNAGKSQAEIANLLNVSKSMVSKWINLYKDKGTVVNNNPGGRPRKTTLRDDRNIKKIIKKNPFVSSKKIVSELGLSVDASTVRRRARECGLKSYTASKKPLLTKRHAKKRYVFLSHTSQPLMYEFYFLDSNLQKNILIGQLQSGKVCYLATKANLICSILMAYAV